MKDKLLRMPDGRLVTVLEAPIELIHLILSRPIVYLGQEPGEDLFERLRIELVIRQMDVDK